MTGKYLVIMRYLTSTICIVLILLGCDRTVNASEQPKVVRKKVVAQKEQIAKAGTNETVLTAKTTTTATKPRVVRKKVGTPKKQTANISRKKTVADTDQAKAGTEAKNQTVPNAKPIRQKLVAKKIEAIPTKDTVKKLPASKKPAVRPRSDLSELTQPPTSNSTAPSDKLIAATSNVTLESRTAGIPKNYDAIGKVDPFEPLFREKPVSVKKNKSKKKRIPRTPLERIDLSQLKLVGIILASSGNRALVEESTGKGYVIKEGTYIGMNSGKVVNIKKEKVVVEEEFEDVFGKTKFRQREIKLPKPPGEF